MKEVVVIALITGTFFAGVISGWYSVREAVMWYSVNKVQGSSNFPTGYQVLNELNKYRRANGLPDFILYEPLCNNIAARWDNYQKNNSHAGLEEFAKKYMHGQAVSEILAPGMTAEATVKNWANSPSHDLFIKSSTKACVYSAKGLSVALLSN